MRNIQALSVFAGALLLCAVVASPAFAAPKGKVGFVDLQRTLNESNAGKQAKKDLESIIKEKQLVIDEKMKARAEAEADFEKKMLVLSDDAKRSTIDNLQKIQKDIERLISDAEDEVQKVQRDREVAILKDLETIITEIAKKRGFSIILPSDVILFGADGSEITDEVIKKFNKHTAQKAEFKRK